MDSLLTLLFVSQMGMIMINGWTDAPNAILSVVCSKTLSYRKAVLLAAVCNFFGVMVFSHIHPAVADTISEMIRLDFTPVQSAVLLLCAMLTVIFYGCAAWWFAIPTSESHALIAGLTGAAMAFGGLENIRLSQWMKVLYGLGISLPLGFLTGWLATLLLQGWIGGKSRAFLRRGQILSAAFMAFAHSAQDGLKFTGVFMLMNSILPFSISLSQSAALTGLAMTAGTLLGGKRIISHVGEDMVGLDPVSGLTSDLAGILCLGAATLGGLPVSTTHTKTMAVAGAGLAHSPEEFQGKVLGQMAVCWLLTFPACGLLGWLLAMFMQLVRLG